MGREGPAVHVGLVEEDPVRVVLVREHVEASSPGSAGTAAPVLHDGLEERLPVLRLDIELQNGAAAQAFFERAIRETAVTPKRVTTDEAKGYPPALRAVLRGVEHRRPST